MTLLSGPISDDGRDVVAAVDLLDLDSSPRPRSNPAVVLLQPAAATASPPSPAPAPTASPAVARRHQPAPESKGKATCSGKGKATCSGKGAKRKHGRPPLSPTPTPPSKSSKGLRSLLFGETSQMSAATASGSSIKTPCSEGSETEPLFGSQPESTNDSEPIDLEEEHGNQEIIPIDVDEEEEDDDEPRSKRKLTSPVWKEFKRVRYMGVLKAKCNYCSKKLSGITSNGTSHLHDHLKICTPKKIKMGSKKSVQPHLRFGATNAGVISVENYTFDQDIARKALISTSFHISLMCK